MGGLALNDKIWDGFRFSTLEERTSPSVLIHRPLLCDSLAGHQLLAHLLIKHSRGQRTALGKTLFLAGTRGGRWRAKTGTQPDKLRRDVYPGGPRGFWHQQARDATGERVASYQRVHDLVVPWECHHCVSMKVRLSVYISGGAGVVMLGFCRMRFAKRS